MGKFQQVYTGEFVKWTGDNVEEVQNFLGMFVFVGRCVGEPGVLFLANTATQYQDFPPPAGTMAITPEARGAVVIAPAYIGRSENGPPGRYKFHLYSDYGDAASFSRSWSEAGQ